MEEVKLPKEVDIQIDDELREFISNSDKDGFEEYINNYLSDEYGYCHFGWNYDIDANEDKVHVKDIEWDTSESLKEDKEEDAEDIDVEAEVEVEEPKEDAKEPKLETFEEKIDFLVKDEDEAIAGYDKIIAMLGDGDVNANAIEQLTHIKEEEIAHKDFLEVLKKDPSAIYNHEDEEEPIENDDDKIEVSNDEFIDDIALDDIDDAFDEGLDEDTIKKGNKWVNKGADGEHGEFKTKKEADAQRKAMFANGYQEDFDDDFGFNHVIDDDDDFEKLGTVNWDDLDDEDAEIIRKGNEAHKKLMGVKEIRDAVVDDTLNDFPERKRNVIKKALDMKFEKPIEEDSHNTGHIKAKKPIELKARVEK